MAELEREQWGSRLGFLMAAMGSAVGLGNIWRFPYICYENGGGAFLIPYFVALLVVGIPLMMLEFGLGHHMKSAAPRAFGRIGNRFSWIGWWAVTFVMFGIVVYYSVVIAWCLCYFFKSFTLAWGENTAAYFSNFVGNLPPDEAKYGTDAVPIRLYLSSFNWQVFLALAAIWFINWLISFKGITQGIERANKIFIPVLVVILTVLVLWSCTQFEGAGKGLDYYFNFSAGIEKLNEPGVWLAAFSQIFFTLSLGFGIMIAYASYLPDDSNIPGNAVIASVGNCVFSVFAGLAVFATIGLIAQQHGVQSVAALGETEGVPDLGGPGLVFATYPELLNSIPGGRIFGVLFFAALVLAGLSSSISIVEAFSSAITDRFDVSRKTLSTILCSGALAAALLFCFDCGLYILDILDHFCLQYGLVIVALLECIIVGWIFTARRLRAHLDDTPGLRFTSQTNVIMRVLITLVLGLTWYGLWQAEVNAASGTATHIGIGIGRILLLGGVLLLWLDEHWLDFDIKVVIPALLVYLLDRQIGQDMSKVYGNYEPWAVAVFGVAWLTALLIAGVIIDYFFRRKGEELGEEM